MGKHKAEHKKDTSPHIPQAPKVKEFEIKTPHQFTPKQLEIIKCILDKNTKIVFIQGVAGTAKSYLSVYCGLRLLKDGLVRKINYVRSAIESASKSIGFLPGEVESKIQPYAKPLVDKMEEFLNKPTIERLINDDCVRADLVNFLRGQSLNVEYLLCDEAQNLDKKELTTIITRFGKRSKFIFTGDVLQSDINGRSYFKQFCDLFDDNISRENGIFTFKLGIEDVLRSEELKYILGKLEEDAAKDRK